MKRHNGIKKHLLANGFYSYETTQKNLKNDFTREFTKTIKLSNKNNIAISDKKWSNLNSFGPKREILVIELGGSNLQLFTVKVDGQKKLHISKKNPPILFYKNKIYTPKILFQDIKTHLDRFITAQNRPHVRDCVFIFTFPIAQFRRKNTGIIDAKITKITKNIRHKNLIGLKIGTALEKYLQKNEYPNITVSITNDSITSLLTAKNYEIKHKKKFDNAINIIVGTGTNIAASHNMPHELQLINTEFGSFKSPKPCIFDLTLHKQIATKNDYLTEKMVSGIWKPILYKIILEDLVKNKIIPKTSLKFLKKIPLDSGIIEKNISTQSQKLLWNELTMRAATICGLGITALISSITSAKNKQQNQNHFAIVQVGSVLHKAPQFKKQFQKTVNQNLPPNTTCEFITPNILDTAVAVSIFSTISNHQKV